MLRHIHSYSQDGMEVEGAALIWQFRSKQNELLNIGSVLKSHNQKNPHNLKIGSFSFGRKTSCLDVLQLVNCQDLDDEERRKM